MKLQSIYKANLTIFVLMLHPHVSKPIKEQPSGTNLGLLFKNIQSGFIAAGRQDAYLQEQGECPKFIYSAAAAINGVLFLSYIRQMVLLNHVS